jgi:hypothetical protein
VDSANDIGYLSNSNGHHHSLSIPSLNNGSYNYSDENSTLKRFTFGRSDAKRLHRKIKKYQIGEATDDVRLCIMCLRAIMNNQVNKRYKRDFSIQYLSKYFTIKTNQLILYIRTPKVKRFILLEWF